MIDHIWTVICSRAVIDQYSNNVSIQNVIERFKINAVPKEGARIPVRFMAVTLWARSELETPAQGRERLTLFSPSRAEIMVHEGDIDLSGDFSRFRSLGRFQAMPAAEPGRYMFRVELQEADQSEWLAVAHIPVEMVFEAPEPEEESAGTKEEE